MASSGIRVGAIQTLKVKSVKRLDSEVGIVTVYPESKDSVYAALVTPEFLTSLDEYLKYRKSQGEKITAESWSTNNSRHLFRFEEKRFNYVLLICCPCKENVK
jgi:hypothetical protein